MLKLNQALLKALKANGTPVRATDGTVAWFDGPEANFAAVHEDGPDNLLVIVWNRIDKRMSHWAEYKVFCLRSELPAVAQWVASGFDELAWCKRRFPLGIRVWSQRHPNDDKAYWQLRTAAYQEALERGRLALTDRDRSAMERWLLGQPA